MDEIVFDSEEVLFTFEGNDYSAMVDFYGEEEWKLLDVMIWNDTEKSWISPFFPKDKKELTKFMNREIDSHGNNIFETAYTAKYEPTDWKDDYND
jgi:hypothetical protein